MKKNGAALAAVSAYMQTEAGSAGAAAAASAAGNPDRSDAGATCGA